MRYRLNEAYLLGAATALVIAIVLAVSARLFSAPVRVSELALVKWPGAALLTGLAVRLLRAAFRRM
ncbi:hypothetical protein [Flaviaesturariibacter aridisoli]|uniref:Uncharacterized protein n=1 Tax=Flaviaesturariibacter aridisoli TaxID=2545761 RepID=A0A4R4E4X9_9BACT|nr:hypothetical protein [Flaviaesturariibacter aridisoli]TCZ74529.1 hypothetical protein E0486_02570 [Flaviaesturariibacter aridisoli]